MTTDTNFTTAAPAALSPTTHVTTAKRVVAVKQVVDPDPRGAWDITFEDGQSVQTRWHPFVLFAQEAQRRGVRVEFETDPDDGITLQSIAASMAEPPATVAVRKLCVHQMVVAQSHIAPLFPGVDVRDVMQVFDHALAQELV